EAGRGRADATSTPPEERAPTSKWFLCTIYYGPFQPLASIVLLFRRDAYITTPPTTIIPGGRPTNIVLTENHKRAEQIARTPYAEKHPHVNYDAPHTTLLCFSLRLSTTASHYSATTEYLSFQN
ncbi:unnamed protein product, partial [Ectocarpus sp. 6 AP-2014]